ncbi:hypothetical protein [Yeosuana marina]|uniref:hypothetical protein n=1 Tax=Yeosuana marina TaxID=1565536 RepID=UPI0030C7E33A
MEKAIDIQKNLILIDMIDVNKFLYEDRAIEDDNVKLNYLNSITENLRVNNKKIARNSFWMVLSSLLYVLILFEEPSVKNISILFVTIENNLLLINLIPVFFSFIFFQNVALWNNNINLQRIFENLSQELYKLGTLSDTKDVIKPFLLTNHVINYQYNNKRIKAIFKLPITIVLLLVVLPPIPMMIYSIYKITMMNTPALIPIVCGILVGIICFSSIVQLFNPYKH